MKKFTEILGVSMLVVFLTVGSAFAFGTEITISDENVTDGYNDSWHNTSDEDDEVEPGMSISQSWDLEGIFLDGTSLNMIGGYDFENGNNGTLSGDVFIDVDGDAVFGDLHRTWGDTGKVNGNEIIPNTSQSLMEKMGPSNFGYDYVLDMNFDDFTYDVYELTDTTRTQIPYEKANLGSGPWRYLDGGNLMAENIGFGYETGLTDAETGFQGGTHNAVTGLDIGFIASEDVSTEFIVHFTMACGNDNLMGAGSIGPSSTGGGGGSEAGSSEAPEPATMLLLGAGLLGLASLRKRFNKKG